MKKYLFLAVGFLSSCTLSESEIRTGDIHIDDIPSIIRDMIVFFMQLAGTIAVVFVIIGAYQLLFGSIDQEKTKGKQTIIMALGGFAIATLAGIIIKFIIDNLQ